MSGLAPVALPVDDPPPSSLNIQDAPPRTSGVLGSNLNTGFCGQGVSERLNKEVLGITLFPQSTSIRPVYI